MLIFKTLRDEPTDHESTDESQRIKTLCEIRLFNNDNSNNMS